MPQHHHGDSEPTRFERNGGHADRMRERLINHFPEAPGSRPATSPSHGHDGNCVLSPSSAISTRPNAAQSACQSSGEDTPTESYDGVGRGMPDDGAAATYRRINRDAVPDLVEIPFDTSRRRQNTACQTPAPATTTPQARRRSGRSHSCRRRSRRRSRRRTYPQPRSGSESGGGRKGSRIPEAREDLQQPLALDLQVGLRALARPGGRSVHDSGQLLGGPRHAL